ncbi:MAG: hypothetical protein K0Q66_1546 [Chitinophagaceae bacterium]|nr:hypothetical protein [Chitinophagaceae bacterium]
MHPLHDHLPGNGYQLPRKRFNGLCEGAFELRGDL